MNKGFRGKNKGITLIALVVSVIVLLILAGISITMLTGENGILKHTIQAKTRTEETQEKEVLEMAVTTAEIGDNGYQKLTQSNLQNVIDNQFGEGVATVIDNEDGTFTVIFKDTHRAYDIDLNGDILNGVDWEYAMSIAKAPSSQDEERNIGVIAIGTDGNSVDMDLWEYTLLDNGTYGLNTENGLDDTGKSGREAGYTGRIYRNRRNYWQSSCVYLCG